MKRFDIVLQAGRKAVIEFTLGYRFWQRVIIIRRLVLSISIFCGARVSDVHFLQKMSKLPIPELARQLELSPNLLEARRQTERTRISP
jgi:hypothetical protein